MRRFCKKTWDELSPEKQETIYRSIEKKKMNHQFVDYNPYYAIQKNAYAPRRTQQLSFNEYYAKFGTTEEQDGWKRLYQPEQQRTIFVKTA